jgi:hypothetical protein
MSGTSNVDQGGMNVCRTVRHIHVTQELRDGKLVTLEHSVFERGMAEPTDTASIFDRRGWQAWLAADAAYAEEEFRQAA